MLGAAIVGEETVVDEEVPHGLHGLDASSKELAEVSRLPAGRPDGTGHPVLDVPCRRLPVDVVDVEVVVVVFIVSGVGDGADGGC